MDFVSANKHLKVKLYIRKYIFSNKIITFINSLIFLTYLQFIIPNQTVYEGTIIEVT